MSKFIITGGAQLNGEVEISGAKNAAIKMICAAIMTPEITILNNVPRIADVDVLVQIIESIGAKTDWLGEHKLKIDAKNVNSYYPNPALMQKMRASVVLAGPLLARFGKAKITEPGGCVIGARPVYVHWNAFKKIGVKVTIKKDYTLLESPKKYKNNLIILDEMSVTATENILMLSAGIKAKTQIHLAAAEPEIQNLAQMLNIMGAKITGAGTHEIQVIGNPKLHGAKTTIIPDRIEAGTFIIASAVAGKKVIVKKIIPTHMEMFFNKLSAIGVDYKFVNKKGLFCDCIVTNKNLKNLHPTKISTITYPGYPTDLQAPISILLSQCPRVSKIFESLYEDRLKYLSQLQKMGVKINIVDCHTAEIFGPAKLKGAKITSFDLRAGATLIIAGIIAKGKTEIDNIGTIDRGYEKIEEKFSKLGARIERTI